MKDDKVINSRLEERDGLKVRVRRRIAADGTRYSTIEYLGKDAKSLAPKRKQAKVADPEKKTLRAEIKRLEQIIREQDAVIARLHANAIEAKQPKVKRWN